MLKISRMTIFILTPAAIVISIVPRPVNTLHNLSMGRHNSPTTSLFLTHIPCRRMVHRYSPFKSALSHHELTLPACSRLLPSNLPPQPLPRLPFSEIRPLPRTRRQPRERRCRHTPNKGRPRVPSIREKASRVQVLVLGDKGRCYRIRMHVVHRV